MTLKGNAAAVSTATGTLNSDYRYTFTQQFLVGSAILAKRARAIEMKRKKASDALQMEHRSCVVSVIMQCVAAIETEVHEIAVHGPGSYLGSNGTDIQARDFLNPLWDLIRDQRGVIPKYNTILRLLKKPPLDLGRRPVQDMALLVQFRNELVHYKSEWESAMERPTVVRKLKDKRFGPPPFVLPGSAFFPHQLLSADCAKWALTSTQDFLDEIYKRLAVPSRLDGFRKSLKVK